MAVETPTDLDAALRAAGEVPGALIMAGGTDVMVEVNAGRRRSDLLADKVISLDRVSELRRWSHDPDGATLTLGAGLTYTELMTEPLASMLPALAEASRTVGSPQIRNAGTVGGNLATCSPAGDTLPVLAALDAEVHLASAAGERTLPVGEFMLGVKTTALRAGELIVAVTVPVLRGTQGYAKVGVRNAMVIAIASACVVTDEEARTVRIALGSVAPTVIRCSDAEHFAAANLDWELGASAPGLGAEIGALAAADARPIDDHRSTAAYRSHAVALLVGRLIRRGFPDA
ncbi:MAG: FAD binding domain-containing protein [Actinomycetota bacterium]|nr:FAD binding domain-containing protein [Actinomycetota bacterium]